MRLDGWRICDDSNARWYWNHRQNSPGIIDLTRRKFLPQMGTLTIQQTAPRQQMFYNGNGNGAHGFKDFLENRLCHYGSSFMELSKDSFSQLVMSFLIFTISKLNFKLSISPHVYVHRKRLNLTAESSSIDIRVRNPWCSSKRLSHSVSSISYYLP